MRSVRMLSRLCLLAPVLACRTAAPKPLVLSAERLSADVEWLADDAREGRRAGTRGEREAALWLAQRFAELGLEGAGEDGYLQEFQVPLATTDGGGSWVEARGERTLAGVDLVPWIGSARGEVRGPLVFRGFGIASEDASWNDWEEGLPEGAVVLVVRGEPDADADFGASASLFHKVMAAARAGAGAVLFAPHPDEARAPLPGFAEGRELRSPVPALFVSARLAETLVPGYEVLAAGSTGGSSQAEVALFADVVRETGTATNVLARARGLGGPTVVVGAHFDHLGRGGSGSLAPDATGEIHNGADDNASGTAVVLELARRLSSGVTPAGDVVFALWSGEELGLLGSRHWVEHPTVDLEGVVGNINLDMVGRAGKRGESELSVLAAGSSPVFEEWLADAGVRSGMKLRVSLSSQGLGGSDHQSFLARRIPALHLFSGLHSDYHRPSDDAHRFEALGAARVVELTYDLLGRMQSPGADVAFAEPASGGEPATRAGSWTVRFGSVPDYAWDGRGLRLAGTSPGSPAEAAGLLEGDVLLEVGDVPIEDIYSFMYVLETHKPGDVLPTRYLRGEQEYEVPVTLEGRLQE